MNTSKNTNTRQSSPDESSNPQAMSSKKMKKEETLEEQKLSTNITREAILESINELKELRRRTNQVENRLKIATFCYCYKKEDYPRKIKIYRSGNGEYKCILCRRSASYDEMPPTMNTPINCKPLDPNPHLVGKFIKPSKPTMNEEILAEMKESGWDEELLTPDEAAEKNQVHEFLYHYVWNEAERRRFHDLIYGYEEEIRQEPDAVDRSTRYHLNKNWQGKSITINGERMDL